MLPNQTKWNINWKSSQNICALIEWLCVCVYVGGKRGSKCMCEWMYVFIQHAHETVKKILYRKNYPLFSVEFDPLRKNGTKFYTFSQQQSKKIIIRKNATNCDSSFFPFQQWWNFFLKNYYVKSTNKPHNSKKLCITKLH